MAVITCNGIQSTATSLAAAPSVPRTSTIAIEITGKTSSWTIRRVTFFDGEGSWDYDTTVTSAYRVYKWNGSSWEQYTSSSMDADDAGFMDVYDYTQGSSNIRIEFDNLPLTTIGISVANFDNVNEWGWPEEFYFRLVNTPAITKQPSITSLNPTSGKQTTATWSAAQVSNLQSYQIKYQYFVGPSSTYSDSYHVGTTTATSATITQAMIRQKCGSSFSGTCYIFVRAYWGNADDSETGGWTTPTGVAFTYDPVTLTAPTNFTVKQSGTNVVFSWSASSASGGSGSVTYRVMQTTDGMSIGTTTGTSLTVAASSIGYAQLSFVVYAEYSNHTAGSSTVSFTVCAPTLSKPTNVSITQNQSQYTISWSPSTGSYGSGSVTYRVFSFSDGSFLTDASTSTSATLNVGSYHYNIEYRVVAYYSGAEAWSETVGYTFRQPIIDKQPVITSINPASGKSTTVQWSAAQVSYQDTATIYYQYFVGPSSTYSDNYHVGTTTSLSATITQANIQSTCGSTFSGTCYIFVRAYWQYDDTGWNGGWVAVSGVAFTYDPVTLSAPGNPQIQQVGQNLHVSWSPAVGEGGSGDVTYVVVYGDEGEIYSAGTQTSAVIPVYAAYHGKSVKVRIWAYYSGKEAVCADYGYITPQPTALSVPGTPIISQEDEQMLVKWTPASGVYGDGEVTYILIVGDEGDIYDAGTNCEITIDIGPGWYDKEVRFVVQASYGSLTQFSNEAYFVPTYHRLVSVCVNGAWVKCIAHYCVSGAFVEVVPFTCAGGAYKECSQ